MRSGSPAAADPCRGSWHRNGQYPSTSCFSRWPGHLDDVFQQDIDILYFIPVNSDFLASYEFRIFRRIEDRIHERSADAVLDHFGPDQIGSVPWMNRQHRLLGNLPLRLFRGSVETAQMRERIVVFPADTEARQAVEIAHQKGRAGAAVGENEDIAIGSALTGCRLPGIRSASGFGLGEFAD